MYERKNAPLVSTKVFGRRMALHVLAALALLAFTLLAGVAGHVYFDDMTLGTALFASTSLIGGLGFSVVPETGSGQLFASVYGILSSYVYIATSSIILAPILHRMLHKFHLDEA